MNMNAAVFFGTTKNIIYRLWYLKEQIWIMYCLWYCKECNLYIYFFLRSNTASLVQKWLCMCIIKMIECLWYHKEHKYLRYWWMSICGASSDTEAQCHSLCSCILLLMIHVIHIIIVIVVVMMNVVYYLWSTLSLLLFLWWWLLLLLSWWWWCVCVCVGVCVYAFIYMCAFFYVVHVNGKLVIYVCFWSSHIHEAICLCRCMNITVCVMMAGVCVQPWKVWQSWREALSIRIQSEQGESWQTWRGRGGAVERMWQNGSQDPFAALFCFICIALSEISLQLCYNLNTFILLMHTHTHTHTHTHM